MNGGLYRYGRLCGRWASMHAYSALIAISGIVHDSFHNGHMISLLVTVLENRLVRSGALVVLLLCPC